MQNKATQYFSEDTIAAPVTGTGGAINVIRVSGPDAFTAVSRLCLDHHSSQFQDIAPGQLKRTKIYNLEKKVLDEILLVRFIGPKSFTGEDVVEFHLHGSPYIARKLMSELSCLGIRPALPGEFSFRAVRNGKIDLTQAQAIADLIGATDENSSTLALEKIGGSQSRMVSELAESLRELCSLCEVGIDFSDQDVEEVSLRALKRKISPVVNVLERLKSSFKKGQLIQEGISITLLGLPNAGKSSFFNALLGQDRSIVSTLAGTTRDIVKEKIVLEGKNGSLTFRIADTAGIHGAKIFTEETQPTNHDEIEKIGVEKSWKEAQGADLVLFLVDSSASLTEAKELLLKLQDQIGHSEQKLIGVLSKSDLASQQKQKEIQLDLAKVVDTAWIPTSSVTLDGISDVIEEMLRKGCHWTAREKGEVFITQIEQVHCIEEAIEHLRRAQTVQEHELLASDVRQSLSALNAMIGETLTDDILHRIFSRFCIGK